MKEIIEQNKNVEFPNGMCCAENHRCAECGYMEMDNNAYNDNTRRCAYYGRWINPSTPACVNFKW